MQSTSHDRDGNGNGNAPSSAGQVLRLLGPALPYAAVLLGLFVLENAWASMLIYHAGVALSLTVTRSWVVPRMSRTTECRVILAIAAVAAVGIGPVIYGMWSNVSPSGFDLVAELAELGLDGWRWTLFVVYYFTINPVLEETYWRSFLAGERTGLEWNDAFFAGYHVLVLVYFVTPVWVAVGFAGLVGVAWFWRQIALRCGGLLIPVVSHAVADFSLIAAAFILAA